MRLRVDSAHRRCLISFYIVYAKLYDKVCGLTSWSSFRLWHHYKLILMILRKYLKRAINLTFSTNLMLSYFTYCQVFCFFSASCLLIYIRSIKEYCLHFVYFFPPFACNCFRALCRLLNTPWRLSSCNEQTMKVVS